MERCKCGVLKDPLGWECQCSSLVSLEKSSPDAALGKAFRAWWNGYRRHNPYSIDLDARDPECAALIIMLGSDYDK